MDSESSATLATRAKALEILLRVERGSYLDALLGPAVAQTADSREAGLLTRLVYGVETWRKRLGWTLAHFCGRALSSLEPEVRGNLRLGLFQILFLDRVPAHAAVDTSVALTKRVSPAGAKLVNAILRRVGREGEFPGPDPGATPTEFLATHYSHPEWLVERWLDQRGPASTEALLLANNEPGPSAFRVDLRKTSRETSISALSDRGVQATASPYAPTAILVDGPVGAVSGVPDLQPQSVASQIVTCMLAPRPGERILDLCAAPGGKAAALAEAAPAGALLIASDRSRGGIRRAGGLRRERSNLIVLRSDGTRPPFAPGSFDSVLLDAPCSGLGTLRAHPELRWRRQPADIDRLAGLQERLLAKSATLVRPGGQLVYATCTLLRQENESNIATFLARHPGWEKVDPRPHLGEAARFVDDDMALRTTPENEGLDGFFAVGLRNRADGV